MIQGKDMALRFSRWQPDCALREGPFGACVPQVDDFFEPEILIVPLVAFDSRGGRLGYGGGFYDRTLATLRTQGDVFACGVAYAGQEGESLPTDSHDERLDGILTEDGFRRVL